MKLKNLWRKLLARQKNKMQSSKEQEEAINQTKKISEQFSKNAFWKWFSKCRFFLKLFSCIHFNWSGPSEGKGSHSLTILIYFFICSISFIFSNLLWEQTNLHRTWFTICLLKQAIFNFYKIFFSASYWSCVHSYWEY